MAAPIVMSDEDLYQLTGSWEAAAALRDEQNNALNQYNWSQAAATPVVSEASKTPTLEELKALYAEKGATEKRYTDTEQGRTEDYIPIQYGNGWSAFENDNRQIIGYEGSGMDAQPIYSDTPKTLGGFSKQEGDYVYNYDPNGNYLGRTKWNEDTLKTMIRDLGPLAMAAVTMGGGAGMLGNALFGLEGTAASAAGGALAGGVNAYGNDQDILKGALLGGVSGAGSAKLSDILGAENVGSTLKNATVGDVTKAINFVQNPTLTGAANLASPYIPNVSVGDGAVSLNDVIKGVGTAQALSSGDYNQIFKAITGIAKDQGNLKSGLAGFEANPNDFTEGYFQPGGEGYNALMAGDTTVLENPQNLDAFLRELSPYATDSGTSVFKQPEDIPEMETVAKRPTSLVDVLGTPDILQKVEADVPELTITGDRPKDERPSIYTKEIKSDIPDEITKDQIDKLFPNININDILQTVTPGGTKTVTPGGTKTTTPGTQTTQQALANLGLNAPMPSQDPYANIKLMEELFGGDTAYKLRALGAPKNLASADLDALARLLRG